jgi:hypothetical protein
VAKNWHRIADPRRRMEWALMSGEAGDARHLLNTLKMMLRYFVIAPSESPLAFDPGDMDIAFPAAMEAMAEGFDARECVGLEMKEE